MSIYDINLAKQEYLTQFYQTLLNVLSSSGTTVVGGSTDLAAPRLNLIAMVKVKIDELMPESEGLDLDLANSDNSNILDLYINALLDESAKHTLQEAPLSVIIPTYSAATASAISAGSDIGIIYLPDDFLRFVSLKIAGWLQEITTLETTRDKSYSNQKYSAIRSGVAKPKGYISSAVKTNVPVAQVESVTLTGTSGKATILGPGGLSKEATFASSLNSTATAFVSAHAAAYLAKGITLTSQNAKLIFTATTAGIPFDHVSIFTTSGDLSGDVSRDTANVPTKEPKRVIEYYSDPAKAHVVDKFLYVANVGAEHVQDNLLDALTWMCAAKVLQIWGEFSGNAAYSTKALEQFKLSLNNIQ